MSEIDKHLRKFLPQQRETLQELRLTILSVVPNAKECLSYGMPAFSIDGKVVAGFDGFKNHCSYFPHSGSVLKQIQDIPDWCTVTKGTLKFPIGKKLPKSLVRKLIEVRIKELTGKSTQPTDQVWKLLGLAAPARRALLNAKLTKVSQLQKHRREAIAALHGMGPNAMKILDAAMKSAGVKFKKS